MRRLKTDTFDLRTDTTTKRETGRKAQLGNIAAAKVRAFTTLYVIRKKAIRSMKVEKFEFCGIAINMRFLPSMSISCRSQCVQQVPYRLFIGFERHRSH